MFRQCGQDITLHHHRRHPKDIEIPDRPQAVAKRQRCAPAPLADQFLEAEDVVVLQVPDGPVAMIEMLGHPAKTGADHDQVVDKTAFLGDQRLSG